MNCTITVPVQLTLPVLGDDLVSRTIGTLSLDITDGAITEDHLRERLGELLLEAGHYLTSHREFPEATDEASLTLGDAVIPIIHAQG